MKIYEVQLHADVTVPDIRIEIKLLKPAKDNPVLYFTKYFNDRNVYG